MTQEELFSMADQTRIEHDGGRVFTFDIFGLTEFAALVSTAKKQQLIDLCEREIQRVSIEHEESRLGNGQFSCGITGFDEGLYAAYHAILKELLK